MAFYSLNYYLITYLYPFHLNAMHPYPDGICDTLPLIYKISFIIFLAISGSIIWVLSGIKDRMVRHQIIFGLFFFLINMIFVLHIIPIKGRVVVADRYTYLGYFGLFFSTVVLLHHFYSSVKKSFIKKAFQLLTVLIFVLLSFKTYTRNKVWMDDYSFWGDVIEKAPLNHFAQFSLGLYYFEKKNYTKALEQYNTAIKISQNNYEYFANRGACYIKMWNIDSAKKDFGRAIALNPKDYSSYNNRGNLYFKLGDITKSITDFKTALKIKPDFTESETKLEQADRLNTLINKYNLDLTQSRELSEYYNQVGVDKAMNGMMAEGLIDFELSAKYDTLNIGTIKNRGNAYASLKRYDDAEKDYIKIINIFPDDAGAYLNLANIKHETGDTTTACEYWNKALSLGLQGAKSMIDKFCKK